MYDHMLSKLPDNECRFIVYRFDFKVKANDDMESGKDKIILLTWLPETTKPSKKLVFAATTVALKNAIGGIISTTINAHTEGELQLDNIVEHLNDMANIRMCGAISNIEGEAMDTSNARN